MDSDASDGLTSAEDQSDGNNSRTADFLKEHPAPRWTIAQPVRRRIAFCLSGCCASEVAVERADSQDRML